MLPYLRLFRREVPTYGLLMALGALLGWLLCRRRAARAAGGPCPAETDRHFVFLGLCALAGAKVYSLVLVWPALAADLPLLYRAPLLFLQRYVYGGLVFYGGLFGLAAGAAALLAARRISFPLLEEVFLPALPLVHAVGRVGCFCAGCCYGKPTSAACGVVYPPGGLAPAGVPLVPIQLWEAAGDLALLLLLLPAYRRPGRRLAVYLLGYGLLRFCTEFYRGDEARGLAGPVSGAQIISLFCIAAGLTLAAALHFSARRGAMRPGAGP